MCRHQPKGDARIVTLRVHLLKWRVFGIILYFDFAHQPVFAIKWKITFFGGWGVDSLPEKAVPYNFKHLMVDRVKTIIIRGNVTFK
jgi:hypothetical protein